MKKTTLVLLGLLFFSAGAAAEGSVKLASDFLVRGHSQTGGTAAMQGSISKSFDNGIYVGTWGSNIGFDGGLELDAFTGVKHQHGDFTLDAGILHHNYPNQPFHEGGLTSNFTEYYGKVSWNKGLGFGYYHSPDYFSIGGREAGNNDYFYVDTNLIKSNNHSLDFHYGITKSNVFEYDEWSVTYTKNFKTINFFVEHHDTSGILDEETTLFGISKIF
jgi:uncharacterized protein (TIGR02001 family)